ncbi:MAG: COG4280 domain-containing protein [Caulobacteraceae bacterium]
MLDLSTAAPAVGAAFVASTVEVVEAFTIVLAVATLRGWRPALTGAVAALATLAVVVAALGPALDLVPLHVLQIAIGILLLLFGLGWLRKAVLRAAGLMALHDEDAIFERERAAIDGDVRTARSADWLAGLAAYKAVLLEGLEVVFIVLAVGAGRGLMLPASLGALAAFVLVMAAGLAIHKPLARVPENTLKFAVGVMLSAFGVFWTAEGVGAPWPGGDLALFGLAAAFLVVALALVAAVRPRTAEAAI